MAAVDETPSKVAWTVDSIGQTVRYNGKELMHKLDWKAKADGKIERRLAREPNGKAKIKKKERRP